VSDDEFGASADDSSTRSDNEVIAFGKIDVASPLTLSLLSFDGDDDDVGDGDADNNDDEDNDESLKLRR